MFFELLLFIFIGFLFGVITGLIPGLHPNTIYMLVLAFYPALEPFGPENIIVFVISVAVANTFFDFIPSLFFGAPEEGTELSILPGHKMLMAGRGYDALYLTVAGGFFSTLLMAALFPLFIYALRMFYSVFSSIIHYMLIAIVIWMILCEKTLRKALFSVFIFALSGAFGILVLSSYISSHGIFPALSGMFGISTLIVSAKNRSRIPKQRLHVKVKFPAKGVLAGWLSGIFVGIFPGIGPSQAALLSAQILRTRLKGFITALGSINTSNIIFTVLVLHAIGKTRSGLASFISVMGNPEFNAVLLAVAVSIVAASLSAATVMKTGRLFIKLIERHEYGKISKYIAVFIISIVGVLGGLLGLLIAFTGTMLGLMCIYANVRRSYMMGFFMIPVILFFFGL